MKLIIDIEDEALERLSTADLNLLYTAIKNGKPYEEITNEDIQNAIKQGYNDGYEMARAKFERPQGEWIESHILRMGMNIIEHKCKNCGRWSIKWVRTIPDNFCSNCGAKMGGKEK